MGPADSSWTHYALGAQAVLGFDRVANALATILGLVAAPLLYLAHDFGEVPVLDALPDPA